MPKHTQPDEKRLPVPYEDYAVTHDGRVISYKRPRPRELKLAPRGRYLAFCACPSDGSERQRTLSVHVMIALVFIGPCPSGYQVAHNNGDRLDNRAENIRYATPAENQADRIAHGTSNRGERHGAAKLTDQDVLEIRKLYAAGGVILRALSERFGVSVASIGYIVNRQTWKHLGDPDS